ncbi:MAG: hypothetical protein LBV41_12350 [Cytophagaceae bacterium]|jgi:signal peptidase I|nr:hypothetical protein [Cytophagaceae bacterium]
MAETSANVYFFPLLDELLQKEQSVHIAVTGLSMFPFLLPGDVVQVEPVQPSEFRKGMILVFKMEEKWVAHRLIKFDHPKRFACTRGDSRTTKDRAVDYEDIKGAVTQVIKSRWKIAQFATGRFSGIIARISPITAILFNFVTYLLSLKELFRKNISNSRFLII